jgi:hypothetical protein
MDEYARLHRALREKDAVRVHRDRFVGTEIVCVHAEPTRSTGDGIRNAFLEPHGRHCERYGLGMRRTQ